MTMSRLALAVSALTLSAHPALHAQVQLQDFQPVSQYASTLINLNGSFSGDERSGFSSVSAANAITGTGTDGLPFTLSGAGGASVQRGWLQGNSSISLDGAAAGYVNGTSVLHDFLRFNTDNPGEQLWVTYKLSIHGSTSLNLRPDSALGNAHGGLAHWQVTADLGSASYSTVVDRQIFFDGSQRVIGWQSWVNDGAPSFDERDFSGEFELTTLLRAGVDQPFQLLLSTTLQSNVPDIEGDPPPRATGDGAVDFSQGVSWGGITRVQRVADLSAVTFTVESATGTNYLNAFGPTVVPEPGTNALLLAGLLVLGLLRKRTSASPFSAH